jgi:hypothetical protein
VSQVEVAFQAVVLTKTCRHSAYAQSLMEPLSIWPPGPGNVLVAQQPDHELTSILNQIDPKRIQAIIEKLVSFGTRHTGSNQTDPVRGIGAARDWIAAQMRTFAEPSNGRMTVTVPGFMQQPTSDFPNAALVSNIVATLTGSKEPNRVYVVSGHYDSRVTSILNNIDDAPGADDDGSGVAISMELARIMATHQPAATIMFAVVAGEEQGLFGSNFMATTLKQQGVDVQGMLDNDIVGASKADDGTNDPFSIRMFVSGLPPSNTASQNNALASIGGENDSPAHQLGRFIAEVSQNGVTQMNGNVIYLHSIRATADQLASQCAPFSDRIVSCAGATTNHSSTKDSQQSGSRNRMRTLRTSTRTSASSTACNLATLQNSAISSSTRVSEKSTAPLSGRWRKHPAHPRTSSWTRAC